MTELLFQILDLGERASAGEREDDFLLMSEAVL